jgi:5-methyltetrahydrofolate--homocysteine methyltransferase
MPADDIFIDMSVSAIIADTEGLNRSTIDAIALIGADPATEGRAHDGRAVQHRPAAAAQGGRRLGPQAHARVRLPDADRAARLRHRAGHALARLRAAAAGPLRAQGAYRTSSSSRGTHALRAVRKFYRA